MKKKDHYDEIIENGFELIEFYRNNPCIALEDLLNVDLAPIQRMIFNEMWFKDYTIGVCSRGSGKSYMLGCMASLSALLYPGYRVGLISSSFRQCLMISDSYDTFWTNKGLITKTENLYNSIETNKSKIQSLETQNIVKDKWLNEERDCIGITTTKGLSNNGTVDHKICTLGKNLNIDYKELQDITENDFLVVKRGFNYFGNDNSMPNFDTFDDRHCMKEIKIPEILTPDLAYWMGLLVGDGCLTSGNKDKKTFRLSFTNMDNELIENYISLLKNYFIPDDEKVNISINQKVNSKAYSINYFSKRLFEYLVKCGMSNTISLYKKVPDIIKRASKECVVGFLQGLMDTDGSVYIQTHKHGYTHCEVALNTSSLQMAKEVQSILLNIGIISNLAVGNKPAVKKLLNRDKDSICSTGYKIRITGIDNLIKFDKEIGFRLKRKDDLLKNAISNPKVSSYGFTILNHNNEIVELINKYKLFCKSDSIEDKRLDSLLRSLTKNSCGIKESTLKYIIECCDKQSIGPQIGELYYNLKYILDNNLFFVNPVKIEYFKAKSIDIEVENESCYWTNGFISHNSKNVFAEVEKLYNGSSIMREACIKPPIRGADSCTVKFKSVANRNGSFIEALPLGDDGAKIRGSRFYLICVDELAQVPSTIIDMVIKPMGATNLNPMENVHRIEQQKALIEAGLATSADFGEEKANKLIMTSSGYYKFNHMWKRMKDYWHQMDLQGDKSKYSVIQIPYSDLPVGFMEKNNIESAKLTMSSHEFRMEYEAEMVSDSDGFFTASLIESCIDTGFTIEPMGIPDGSYVMGVDPSHGSKASFGIVIIRIGTTSKIVNVLELKKITTQEGVIVVQKLCRDYNIEHICVDRGGGGSSLKDLLEIGYNNEKPIFDINNEDNKNKPGRHILELINFAPQWISDINHSLLAALEGKKIVFPGPFLGTNEYAEDITTNINTLKGQLQSIIITETSTGMAHFDTAKKSQQKDLYSALLLAHCAAEYIRRNQDFNDLSILYKSGGFVRERNSGTWSSTEGINKSQKQDTYFSHAILHKK